MDVSPGCAESANKQKRFKAVYGRVDDGHEVQVVNFL